MWKKEKWMFMLLIALLLPWSAQSQQPQRTTARLNRFVKQEFRQSPPAPHKLIQLTPDWKYYLARKKKAGWGEQKVNDASPVEIIRRLDSDHYILSIDPAIEQPQLDHFDLVLPAKNTWKLSPKLSEEDLQHDKPSLPFFIKVTDLAAFKSYLREKGSGKAILQEFPAIQALLIERSPADISELILPSDLVTFVDLRNRTPREERAVNNFDLSVNQVNYVHAYHPLVNGRGLAVSVKEFRPDSTDIDFRGRYIPSPLSTALISTHATTMASMIAGGGNSFYTGKGVAWQAGISSASFLNLFPEEYNYYQNDGITTQNHSYGLDIENYYGGEALAYDQQVYETLPHLVHVFSAGNKGDSTSQAGPYRGVEGFANLSGNFKMAKNVLTVGAVDSFYTVETLSSRGPAFDGRVKPELVALGQDGSSGAAAITSGLVLLLQQAYREQYGEWPSAALIRSVLLNSADDLLSPGPDYVSGYGNVNARRAMEHILNEQFIQDSISPAGVLEIPLDIPAEATDLKITLAWTDPPGLLNSSPALVHDLDITLVSVADGIEWQPWVLSTAPHADSLRQAARRGVDRLNNQEQISISAPDPGRYLLRIKAGDLPEGAQRFSVSYDWRREGQFTWTFPTRSDNARAGERIPLRWESHLSNTTGAVDYRLIGSEAWININASAILNQPYTFWDVPDTFALAQLRLRTAGQTFLSDTFTISRPLQIQPGFDCPDSLLLYWNKAPDLNRYQVFSLERNYLEVIQSTPDTQIVLNREAHPSNFFAVAPVIQPGINGRRSLAINLEFQNAGCYINSFFARLQDDRALLEFNIGTTYEVEAVIFEKWENGQFAPILVREPAGNLTFRYEDEALTEGDNHYRAGLRLRNGQIIYSNEQTIFYVNPGNYLIFPNPVAAGQSIRIRYNVDPGSMFSLYNGLGQLIQQRQLFGRAENIATQNLPGGLYFYTIYAGEQRVREGKIRIE